MKCDDFRSWMEREGQKPLQNMPDDFAEHLSSCPTCESRVKEETVWQRFFGAAPEASLSRSLCPGVMAKIQEQQARNESFNTTFVLLGRRLAPAFALFLLLLGGVTFWRVSGVESQDSTVSIIAMVENSTGRVGSLSDEPDTVLNSWLGVNQE